MADEEGYIDNWPGNLKVELASPDLPQVIALPAEQAGPSLSERLRLAWVENLARTSTKFGPGSSRAAACANGVPATWPRQANCARVRHRFFPNRLDLKYVIAGNRVQFVAPTPTVLGQWADPFIEVNFNIVIRMTLVFDTNSI